MTEIKKDQIWREKDSRFDRFVRITDVTKGVIYFQTCEEDGALKRRTRPSSGLRGRFERGAYTFVREAP